MNSFCSHKTGFFSLDVNRLQNTEMKGRSCFPSDPKIIVCICFGAFWIGNRGVVAGGGQEGPWPAAYELKKGKKLASLNVNGLRSHLDEIELLIRSLDIHALTLDETKLDSH